MEEILCAQEVWRHCANSQRRYRVHEAFRKSSNHLLFPTPQYRIQDKDYWLSYTLTGRGA